MGIYKDEAMNCSYPYPTSKTAAEWDELIWNELIEVFSLKKPLDDACDAIATKMDELLASEH